LYPLIFRTRDHPEFSRVLLRQEVESGALLNPWRGIYVRPDAPLSNRHLAAFALRRPDAVFGLVTALDYHDLTDLHARTVDAFIPRNTRTPRFKDIPHRVIRQRPDLLKIGVQPVTFLEVSTLITSPARTVVDAFRFSRHITLQYAIEALRDYLDSHPIGPLVEMARRFDVYPRLQPYLRALQ
jgi:predicted transcriptional regulator of viral defense system